MRFTAAFALLALPILAAATPNPNPWATTTPATTATVTVTATATSTPVSSCSTGSLQCCDSTESASDPTAAGILSLLGIVVEGVDVLVGLTCDPITVIGVEGGGCSSTVVCCEDNSVDTLISIGCVPVIL